MDVMNSPTASSIFLCVSVSCPSRVKTISIDGFLIPINLLVLFCNISRCFGDDIVDFCCYTSLYSVRHGEQEVHTRLYLSLDTDLDLLHIDRRDP